MNGARTAVVVELGRPGALGAGRRSDSWCLLWEAAGVRATTLKLVEQCPATPFSVVGQFFRALVGRRTAWETMLWSRRALRSRLAELDPDVVVFCTHRGFDPAVAPVRAVSVLDLVDRLSENYRLRSDLAHGLHRMALLALAARMRRLEVMRWPGVLRTAAGFADADALDATWLPNVVPLPPATSRAVPASEDVLFLGSLDYAPNVEGLRTLARVWPRLLRRHPGARLLVAGRLPGRAVTSMVERHGWVLEPDFQDLAEICSRARIAVAPLAVATGIQNKVLETSAAGLAQIVHPAVLAGLGPLFPAMVAADDDQLLEALAELLAAAPQTVSDAGGRARDEVQRTFSVAAHVGWCTAVLPGRPVVRPTYLGRAAVALRPEA